MKVSAAYVKAPFNIEFREVELPSPGDGQAIVDVLATGICGHDMEITRELARDFQPFGHEICARVRDVGHGVTNIKPGDQVVLESSTFCGVCDDCRNGRPDLCRKLFGPVAGPAAGFAQSMLINARSAVAAEGIDPAVAAMAEPVGVAYDMVRVAEIGLDDNVLVVGCGAIGLMALAIARRRTAGTIIAVNPSKGKLAAALELGADAAYSTKETALDEIAARHGKFNCALVTAPPAAIPGAMSTLAYEGICSYIGFNWGDGRITIDTTAMHLGKQQLRASFASPACWLPIAVDLLRKGVVPPSIVSHRFPLSKLADAMLLLRTDRETTRKVAIIPER